MNIPKGTAFFFCCFLLLVVFQPAEAGSFSQRVRFSPADLSFDSAFGYDTVSLRGCSAIGEVGCPSLPAFRTFIALPQGARATSIEMCPCATEEVPGEFDILPGLPPRTVSGWGDSLFDGYFPSMPLPATGLYPVKLATLDYQSDLARVGLAAISVYPLQYDLEAGKLFLHTEMELTITYDDTWVSPEPFRFQDEDFIRIYEPMIKGMVLNPEDVHLEPDPATLGVDPSQTHKYVIVTQEQYADDFAPLVEWKTKKGLSATVVTTEWIYDTYYDQYAAQKIRSFCKDAASSWSTVWFLMGGDSNIVPHGNRAYLGDTIANDTFYSDYDGDWTCEVFVGRASVASSNQIVQFIDKVLQYEKNPPATEFAKTIGLFGFDLDDQTPTEVIMQWIESNYIPWGWTVSKVYDSHAGNHKSNMTDKLNGGLLLANHMDHCNFDALGAGSLHHDLTFTRPELGDLINGEKQNTFYSVGCWANAFDEYSISEAFVRNTDGGGISFIGNTRFGWYNQGDPSSYSFLYDRNFFRSVFSNEYYKMGQALANSKNITPMGSDPYKIMKYVFTELNLLGDPEYSLWTEDPSALEVTHPVCIMTSGSQTFTVNVMKDGGYLNGATVCLWKEGEVYQTASTNSSGNASLSINPYTGGTLYVTVTAPNCIPYEGDCAVGTGGDGTCTLTLMGGGFNSGDTVVFKVSAPSRPNQNLGLIVNNQPGSPTLPYYGITLPIALTGYQIKYMSWGPGNAGLNGSGLIFITTTNPSMPSWKGTQSIWFAVVGKMPPNPDLVVSNTVEYTIH